MADQSPTGCDTRLRDGVSQQARIKAALQPDYVSVDERSLKDLLLFLREYSKELRYFDENNQENGNWAAFFPQNVSLDEILEFIKNPDSLPENKARACQQPHFVLMLTFLQLLDHSRQHLNYLTRRHLDFYFRQFLQIQEKRALPDHVNVLVELAKHKEAFLLPAGSLLHAGKDDLGKVRTYSTDEDTLLNQAQIATLSAIYVDKQIIGIQEARESYLKKQGSGEKEQKEAFLLMLGIALGHPSPGDALPEYPAPTATNSQKVTYVLLTALHAELSFVHDKLKMSFFRFGELMKLKNRREPNDTVEHQALKKQFEEDWGLINRTLERAGRIRRADNTYKLPTRDEDDNEIRPDDFSKNFFSALELDPYSKKTFFGLPDISDINELYELYQQIGKAELTKLIQEDIEEPERRKSLISLLNVSREANFESMMQTKVRIDGEWKYIDEILERASGKKPKFSPLPTFKEKLAETLGLDATHLSDDIGSIDELYHSIRQMQTYFYMSAYDLYSIMNVAQNMQAKPHEWNKVYNTLASAHKEKVFHNRREKLREAIKPNLSNRAIIEEMLSLFLGNTEKNSIDALRSLLTNNELDYLTQIAKPPTDSDEEDTNNEEWEKVIHIMATAWRNREGSDPIAEKEEWKGLYAAEDVTATVSPSTTETDTSAQPWKTFGQFSQKTEGRQPAEFGLAISSPILLLSQGKRKITLTLEFSENGLPSITQDELESIFHIFISTEKEWEEVNKPTIKKKNGKLEFSITLPHEQGALAVPKSGIPQSAKWPLIKIMFDSQTEKDNASKYYQQLKDSLLSNINIDVKVTGLSDLQIWNDLQQLDSKKPFEPFGSRPIAGSRFYMTHPELTTKKPTFTTFNIEWANLKILTDNYYKNYDTDTYKTGITEKKPFKIKIGKDNTSTSSAAILLLEKKIKLEDAAELIKYPELIYWELQAPDFQHSVYPALAAQKATEMAIEIAKDPQSVDPEKYRLPPPFTPMIKAFTLDYGSSLNINMGSYNTEQHENKVFHLYPFGHIEIQPDEEKKNCRFLPQFDHEGELYIGLEKLKPPQQLSILFQMAEGSADADLPPEAIHWDYLSGNRWHSLENGNILSDGTRGLINSGIIKFSLPSSQSSTLLAPELYWLRARIRKNTNSTCDTVAIHTQAVAATLVDTPDAPGYFNKPLASDTIKKLLRPLPAIKAIHQPYTSFGGKSAEQDQWFYTRVSERLRHKQRALTQWDYEHLVLERFSQIYKTKCIPSVLTQPEDKPGKIEVIVIPDIRNRLPADPFEPKAPVNLLADIQHYLQSIAPDSATILVRNAHYVPFKIRMGVRFHESYDPGYHKKRLNEELNRFLAPWAYTEGADIVIGGKIYANSIINFVERLPYIDYVAQINFFGKDTSSDKNNNNISTKNHSDVLVPEPEHVFDLIPDSGYEEESFTGINYMRIELDFIVGPLDDTHAN